MKSGFTLVELLLVIVIMGLIAVFSIPVYSEYQKAIKEQTYHNKINIIESEVANYADKYLLDELKTPDTFRYFCRYYDLEKYFLANNIINYDEIIDGKRVLINPINEKPIIGHFRIEYNIYEDELYVEYNSTPLSEESKYCQDIAV